MIAATIPAPRTVELTEVALRPAAADEAELDVLACGVCGSNLHEWREPQHGLTATPVPGAAGHELVGRVRVPAADGSGPSTGQRVVVEPNLVRACGRCSACCDGVAWFCERPREVATWGFAERMLAPTPSLFAVPDGVDDVAATLVEPLACAVHALRGTWRAATTGLDGARVAVIGAGVTGLAAAAGARHLGAGQVTVVARYDHQARAAAALGADRVLMADDARLVERLREMRAEIVIEAVGGGADTLELALRAAAPRGEVAVLGLFHQPPAVDARRATYRELRISFPVTYAVQGGVHDFEIALAAVAAEPCRFGMLITHRRPLLEVGEAFALAADKSTGVLRVVVTG